MKVMAPATPLGVSPRFSGYSQQTGFRPQRPVPSSLSEWPARFLSKPVREPSAMVFLVRADPPFG